MKKEEFRRWLKEVDGRNAAQTSDHISCVMDLDLDKCRDLFEVLDTRDGRKSTVVISQFPVSTWFDMFADNTYADACLTRITDKHHTYRLEMNGINMRETE